MIKKHIWDDEPNENDVNPESAIPNIIPIPLNRSVF